MRVPAHWSTLGRLLSHRWSSSALPLCCGRVPDRRRRASAWRSRHRSGRRRHHGQTEGMRQRDDGGGQGRSVGRPATRGDEPEIDRDLIDGQVARAVSQIKPVSRSSTAIRARLARGPSGPRPSRAIRNCLVISGCGAAGAMPRAVWAPRAGHAGHCSALCTAGPLPAAGRRRRRCRRAGRRDGPCLTLWPCTWRRRPCPAGCSGLGRRRGTGRFRC